jgi:deoxyribodipyrimidine photolyase-related protein
VYSIGSKINALVKGQLKRAYWWLVLTRLLTNKMSNFCSGCQFDYKKRVGSDACPFTTLYWEFMDRHYDQLKDNQRMRFPIRNLEKMRKQPADMAAIRQRASKLRDDWSS